MPGVKPEVLKRLADPFLEESVEWRVQNYMADGHAIVVPYITARAVEDRLDEVCGNENWWDEYLPGPAGGNMCGITILVDDGTPTGRPLRKWDGADNSDIEAVKGGFSDSMKRAAVKFGVGRYLYTVDMADCYIQTSMTKGNNTERARVKDSSGKMVTVYFTPPKPKNWYSGQEPEPKTQTESLKQKAAESTGKQLAATVTARIAKAVSNAAISGNETARAVLDAAGVVDPSIGILMLDSLSNWAVMTSDQRNGIDGNVYLCKLMMMVPEIGNAPAKTGKGTVSQVMEKYLTDHPEKVGEIAKQLREKVSEILKERN